MSATSEVRVAERQVLIVGPYGVLGTGIVDAVAENPRWGIITAARRPAPTYREQDAPPHISVDLMDREGTTKAFSSLNKVSDLVFAAYIEKPTMAETVEPNARMLECDGRRTECGVSDGTTQELSDHGCLVCPNASLCSRPTHTCLCPKRICGSRRLGERRLDSIGAATSLRSS